MSSFRVDVAVLGTAAGEMQQAPGAQVEQAGSPAPGAGTVGHEDLTAALGGFASSWGRGAGALRTDTTRAAEGLRVCGLRYAETDLSVDEALRRIGQGLPS